MKALTSQASCLPIRFLCLVIALWTIIHGVSASEVTPLQLIFKTSEPISIRSDRTGIDGFDSFLDRFGAFNLRRVRGMHTDQYFMIDLQEEIDWQALDIEQLRFGGIEYIQPNRLSKLHLTPNDPLYPLQQHHLSSIPQAWNYTTGSPLVVVGVVDSGIIRDHPDLVANLYINPNEVLDGTDTDGNGYIDDWCGWDFVDAPEMADIALGDYIEQDNDVTDENFHGTHVSGIIGAAGNNGIGISGVCWNVKIMPLRAGFRTTQGSGYLQDDDAAAAIIYAADNGCHVINMSWGDPNYSPIIADACQYAYDKGVVLVASAGNDPGPILSYPSKLSNVISVGAVNKFKNLAGFSSYGVDLDLVAPGEQILSTYKNTPGELYMEMSGTSMSAPYVSGAIALLLSLQPGLTPQEVRSRLLTTTDDLGATGFDQLFGHGLLNVYRLLDSTNPPIVEVSYPYDQLGITEGLDIIGTVHGADFFRYSVMYSSKANPTSLDWYDVYTHSNQPNFKYDPVQNGVLASFNIMQGFPEGKYLLRIMYESSFGKKFHYYLTVRYVKSPPVLITQSLYGFKRYDKQNLRYYVSAKFNEAVHSELQITASDGSVHYSHAAVMDSLQVWAIPRSVPEGNISISIHARNISNLEFNSPSYQNFMTIAYDLIPSHGFVGTNVGSARVPLGKTYDFNGNGVQQYIAMDLPASGYGNVSIYEPGLAGHSVSHNFNSNFWPLDIGNTNAAGQEILYLAADTARLMDTKAGSVYPDTLIWSETSISGGIIADYDGNGSKDILLIKNLPTARVLQLYARTTAGNFTPRNTIYNTTPTSQRNTFVPSIIVENFDGDNRPDILTADTDGDIMIYEVIDAVNHTLTWTRRLPVGNAYYMCSGDFDGNGTKDFMVGGYYRDYLNPDMNFWYFEGFTSNGNNSYVSMGTILFNDIVSQNAIQAYDLDNDGKDEIIIAQAPNLYVIKYENGNFVPKWHGSSFRTYQITAFKDSDNSTYFLTNGIAETEGNPDIAVQWTADQPFAGPPTPANFMAVPLDEKSARLSWVGTGADYYTIFRKDEAGNIISYANITSASYIDSTLVEGSIYSYAVMATNSSYENSDSYLSLWQEVVPSPKPVIQSIEMVGSTELRLIFNQSMSSANLNPGFYFVDNGMGNPYSVNHIMNQHGFQLRFRTAFQAIDGSYSLSLRNVVGSTGVIPDITEYEFDYIPDLTAPMIQVSNLLPGHRQVEIIFNETLNQTTATILSNYSLATPANDPDNSIVSVSADGDRVIITLSSQIKSSNQPYYIVVSNVSDLVGNKISPLHNIAKFSKTDITNLKNVVTYPNPIRARESSGVAFLNFPPGKKGTIYIYNCSADLVYKSSIGPFNPDTNNITWRWFLTNNDGRKVSSGVYFYVIDMDGQQTRGKIALIR